LENYFRNFPWTVTKLVVASLYSYIPVTTAGAFIPNINPEAPAPLTVLPFLKYFKQYPDPPALIPGRVYPQALATVKNVRTGLGIGG